MVKRVILVIITSISGICGLIFAAILKSNIKLDNHKIFNGWKHFANDLCYGLSSWSDDVAIWITGDTGIGAFGQQDRRCIGMMLILLFSWISLII